MAFHVTLIGGEGKIVRMSGKTPYLPPLAAKFVAAEKTKG
jgi:hypothetical protein